jgi:hypothetical protein
MNDSSKYTKQRRYNFGIIFTTSTPDKPQLAQLEEAVE